MKCRKKFLKNSPTGIAGIALMRYTSIRNYIELRGEGIAKMESMHQNRPMSAQTQSNHTQQVQRPKKRLVANRWVKIMSGILLVGVGLLIALVALNLAVGGSKEESKYIDKTKFQAVFVNGGQVYFGKLRALNNKFLTLDNIYYLRVNSSGATTDNTSTSQDISLTKLGCELHGPTDEMVVNRDQVLFWENLKDDGQVVTAITKYVKENPQGQTCTTSPSTDTSSSTSTTKQ